MQETAIERVRKANSIPELMDGAVAAYSDLVDRFLGKNLPHRFLVTQKKGFLKRLFGGN